MANSEYYQPYRSIPIAGHSHSDFQGMPIGNDRSPFRDGHIPEFSLVGLNTQSDDKNRLTRISANHGRSLAIEFDNTKNVIWNDEHGIIFTALNSKGNDLSTPEIFHNGSSPSGYSIQGLQESDALLRALKASEVLRSNGIATEVILKAIEPLSLPFKDTVLSREDFSHALIKQIWEDNVEGEKGSVRIKHNSVPSRDEIPVVTKALNDMTLFVTIRGVQTNERIADLDNTDEETEQRILESAFRYFNLLETQKEKKDPTYISRQLSTESPEDIYYYYTELLPKSIAQNIAGFHKLGLSHYFPHSGNISTVGTFYDLDSVRGEAIGLTDDDKPITLDNIKRDINWIKTGNVFSAPGAISQYKTGDFRPGDFSHADFNKIFLDEYIEQMGWVGDIRYLHPIYELADHNLSYRKLLYYQEAIAANLGIKEPFVLKETDAIRVIKQYLVKKDTFASQQKLNDISLSLMPELLDEFHKLGIDEILFEKTSVVTDVEIENSIFTFGYTYVNQALTNVGRELQAFTVEKQSDVVESAIAGSQKVELEVMQQFFLKKGYDTRLENLPAITQAFNHFGTYEDAIYLPYYADILAKKLDVTVKPPITREEMVKIFFKDAASQIDSLLPLIFKQTEGKKNRRQLVQQGLIYSGALRFSIDNYTDFVTEYTDKYIQQLCGEKLEAVISEYGESVAEMVDFVLELSLAYTYEFIPVEEKLSLEETITTQINDYLSAKLLEEGFNPHLFELVVPIDPEGRRKKSPEKTHDEFSYLKHITSIYHDNGGFLGLDTKADRTELIQQLESELGKKFDFSREDEDELVTAFLANQEQVLEMSLGLLLALENEEPGEDVEAYLQEQCSKETATFLDKWIEFADTYVKTILEQRLSLEIEEVLEKYFSGEEERENARDIMEAIFTEEAVEGVDKRLESEGEPTIETRLELLQNEVIHRVAEEYNRKKASK